MNNDSPIKAALSYSGLGWPVLPLHSINDDRCTCRKVKCDSPGKHPRTKNGLKNATTDTGNIEKWWEQRPEANVGIRTGAEAGIIAVDIDPDRGGSVSQADWERQHAPMPETVEAITGGGGQHLLFAHPGGHVHNRSDMLLGIDVRADGGYIVAPPSRHISGDRYQWKPAHAPGDLAIAQAPDSLIELIRGAEQSASRSEHPGSQLEDGRVERCLAAMFQIRMADAKDGSKRVYTVACRCVEHDLSDAQAIRAIRDYEHQRPFPQEWTDDQILARVRDAERECERGLISQMTDPLLSLPSHMSHPEPPDEKVYYGLAGEIVRAIEPHTEADPIALLVDFLACSGSVMGRGAFFIADGAKHYGNMYIVLVGETSKARKGTARAQIQRIFEKVDPSWSGDCVQGGLSTGEGLINAVRDSINKEDPSILDKRLLAFEAEYAQVLKVATREGNTLSTTLRQAWDTGNLRIMTRNSPLKATNAYISIIGHITKEELLRYLTTTEAGNGFGNRFLWTSVRRSKYLPEGGKIEDADLADVLSRLKDVLEFGRVDREMRLDDHARGIWHKVYPSLSEGKPGIFGALVARSEAQVRRLAMIYALLDQSEVIQREHLLAALALWDYCESSVRFIFGDALDDPVADAIRNALYENGSQGMIRTEIRDLFRRHKTAEQINRALAILLQYGHARCERQETDGRPVVKWYSVTATKATEAIKASAE